MHKLPCIPLEGMENTHAAGNVKSTGVEPETGVKIGVFLF